MKIAARRSWLVAMALVACSVSGLASTVAAQGPGGGGGGGSGDLYSDLVVALRDVDGLPILTEYEVEGEEGPTTEHCVQPVSYEPIPGLTETITNEVDGRQVYRIPLIGDLGPLEPSEEEEEVEVCDPIPAFAPYVSEAELERLNMARTNEEVLDRKLADVRERLLVADEVTLDPAGRLVIDGVVVDAPPENAAIFQELMATGTLPTLYPAQVGPFGPWELSAAAIGAAANKFTPISIDAVLYYNRITGAAQSDGWRADPLVLEETGEEFVDYRDFRYTRSEVFPGAVTWLDVPTLTWRTSRIADVVDFAPLPPNAVGGTLANVAGYAQMVEDVRTVISYLHEHETLAGFHMDPVGVDTYDAQVAALTAPAAEVAGVPEEAVQTETFPLSATVLNPWAGATLDDVHTRLRVTVEGGFTAEDATRMSAVEVGGEQLPFSLDGDTLVAPWGDPGGTSLTPGDNVTTAFDLQVGAGAPTGTYTMGVEVVRDDAVLASATTDVEVLPPHVTALWTSATRYVEQGSYAQLLTRTFNPVGQGDAEGRTIRLTIDPLADEGFGSGGPRAALYSDAVSIPLAGDGDGSLVGELDLPTVPEGQSVPTEWYLVIDDGAPLGWYDISVEVLDSPAMPAVMGVYVAPASEGGSAPPAEEAPAAPTTVTAEAGDAEATVSWVPSFDGGPVSGYIATSTPDGRTCVIWGASSTACTVTGLTNGTAYTFKVRAIGEGGLSVSSAASNPVTPRAAHTADESLVIAAHVDFLDREPTAEELQSWATRLASGDATRRDLLMSLATSEEWLGAVVERLYTDTLGRPSDPAGRTYWVEQIRSGRYSVARVSAFFYASPEYFESSGGTIEDWVTALYQTLLHRNPEPAGLDYWVDQTSTDGRTTVAYALFQSRESARARVTSLYEALLDRPPEPAGLTYWAPVVVARGDIVLAVQLALSNEYRTNATARFP